MSMTVLKVQALQCVYTRTSFLGELEFEQNINPFLIVGVDLCVRSKRGSTYPSCVGLAIYQHNTTRDGLLECLTCSHDKRRNDGKYEND
jgi:hypothetical protein